MDICENNLKALQHTYEIIQPYKEICMVILLSFIEKWLKNIIETHGTLKRGQPVFKGVVFSNLGNNEEEYAKQEAEIRELERLAEIGKTTEKAFAENSCVLFIDSIPNINECYEFELTDIKQILEWARNK